MSATICKPTQHHVRVTDDGVQVVLLVDGRPCEMPPNVARQIARALLAKAAAVDELLHASRLVQDEALLLRAGVPLSLTGHPRIRAEAEKVAATDRDLRRYLPGGIKSETHVPAPVVSHVQPAKGHEPS